MISKQDSPLPGISSTDHSPLERILISFLAGYSGIEETWLLESKDLILVLRQVLSTPGLSSEEKEAMEEKKIESMDQLISLRIQKAVNAAIELLAKIKSTKKNFQPPGVVVSRNGLSQENIIKTINLTSPPEFPDHLLVLADHCTVSNVQRTPTLKLKDEDYLINPSGSTGLNSTPRVKSVQVLETVTAVEEIENRLPNNLSFPEPDPKGLLGKILKDKYLIEKYIGGGGFGEVYRANNLGVGGKVAIKFLNPKTQDQRELIENFRNEAKNVFPLKQGNIVRLFDLDKYLDEYYLVMECLDGKELEKFLEDGKIFSSKEAGRILQQILAGLRYAHGEPHRLLHLDLKPKNIFIELRDDNEQVKIIDFGIGQQMSGKLIGKRSLDSSHDNLPSVSGISPPYASPEHCKIYLGHTDAVNLDGRADLYSAGIVGYQLIKGSFPFDRQNSAEGWLYCTLEKPPKKLTPFFLRWIPCNFAKFLSIWWFPWGLARFIDQCLIKDRNRRWKDTSKAFECLDSIVTPPFWLRFSKWAMPIIAVAIAIILVLFDILQPKFELSDEAGKDIKSNPLYFGGQRNFRTLIARDLDLPLDTPFNIMEFSSRSKLKGWRVFTSRYKNDQIKLELKNTGPAITSRCEKEVYLQAGGRSSESFKIIQLPDWKVDRAIPDLGDRDNIYMSGWKFMLEVSGLEREDILDKEVKVSINEKDNLKLGDPKSIGSTITYEFLIDNNLDYKDIFFNWSVKAKDESEKEGRFPPNKDLKIVKEKLEFGKGIQLKYTYEGTHVERAPDNDEFVLFYKTLNEAPQLTFEANRISKLSYEIFKRDQSVLKKNKENTEFAQLNFTVPLNSLDQKDSSSFQGKIDITLDDSEVVFYGTRSDVGHLSKTIKFDVRAKPPEFSARVKYRCDVANNKDLLLERSLLEEKTPIFVCSNKFNVYVIVNEQNPHAVVLNIFNKEGGKKLKTQDEVGKEITFKEIPNLEDELYKINIKVCPLEEKEINIIEYFKNFNIIVDSRKPELKINNGTYFVVTNNRKDKLVLDIKDSCPLPINQKNKVSLYIEIKNKAVGVEIPNSWQKEIELEGDKEKSVILNFDELVLDKTAAVDGKYSLVIQASDQAGNSISQEVECELALKGPTITIQSPSNRDWSKDKGDKHLLRVKVVDPNQLKSIKAEVKTGSGLLSIPVELKFKNNDLYEGEVTFNRDWNKTQVDIVVQAWDIYDNANKDKRPVDEISGIEDYIYYIKAFLKDRNDLDINAMRLVIGNKSKYTLGGKSSDNFEKSWNCEIDAGKIENYYLDENEVTCAQFERFISAGDGFQNEKNWPLPDRKNAKDKIRLNQLLSEVGAKDSELLPVTKVTWSEACAYAEWVGKRLPTLLEWEYAVRGDDSPRVSSWSWRESKVTLGEDINIGGLSPWKVSEEKNKDITPELIRNLCSNVSEWTLTSPEVASKGILELDKLLNPIARDLKIWNHEKYWRVGGSFKDDKNTESFSTFNYKRQRNKCEPIENLSETGFRCAMFERDALKIINKGTVKNLGIKKLSLNNK